MHQFKRRYFETKFGARFPRLNYTINIDLDDRVAYFETPKVACTSIKAYMIARAGARLPDFKMPQNIHDRKKSPLVELGNLNEPRALEVMLGSFKRFSFVRNPYTRILSAYLDKIVQNDHERARMLPIFGFEQTDRPSFLEFLRALEQIPNHRRDIHFVSQADLLMVDLIDYTRLGRMETFDQDFHLIREKLFQDKTAKISSNAGRHHATGAADNIATHYGQEETDMVQALFAADFKLFGYSTDIAQATAPNTPPQHLTAQ
ncbi:MAG: sulfotransferase family protein, partial [Mangrovicoccus sp.]